MAEKVVVNVPPKQCVLIIEDEIDLLFLMERTLLGDGFAVETAVDGNIGLAIARGCRPDLIVLDWMLPGMDGLEVLERLRGEPSTREIPVILVTARAQETDTLRAISTGATDCLIKPFPLATLCERVRVALAPARPSSAR
jgi:two-component system phosphate regulon response regulator PhoB